MVHPESLKEYERLQLDNAWECAQYFDDKELEKALELHRSKCAVFNGHEWFHFSPHNAPIQEKIYIVLLNEQHRRKLHDFKVENGVRQWRRQ